MSSVQLCFGCGGLIEPGGGGVVREGSKVEKQSILTTLRGTSGAKQTKNKIFIFISTFTSPPEVER